MDDWESKLGAIMNDPDMMAKIMSLAQDLNTPQQEAAPKAEGGEKKPSRRPHHRGGRRKGGKGKNGEGSAPKGE